MFVSREQPDTSGICEPRGSGGEVRADFVRRRPLVVAGVLAVLVNAVSPERKRVHAVVRRRRVQADKRIRVQPMATRSLPAVDHGHLDVLRLGHERVGEGEATRPAAHDQIVGLQHHATPRAFLVSLHEA